MYRPKHIAEYAALRIISGIVNILPYRAALLIGWFNAWLSFYVFRFRVAEAKRRIREAFKGRLTEPEISRIAWRSWQNVCFNAIEMMRVTKVNDAWYSRYCDFDECVAAMRSHLQTGKGAIVACPHMGSWEMTPIVGHLKKIPIFSIGARQRNPLVNSYIEELRKKPGIEILTRGSGAMRQIIRRLRSGQILGILPDVRSPSEGVPVPFLGGEAQIMRGTALFAVQTNVPVIPMIVTRKGWAHHAMQFFDPIWPDTSANKESEIRRVTEELMKIIDRAIHEEPEQWFWFNKRWILDPVSESPAPTQ